MQHPERRAIHILPSHLANQIAAGEVVERPASIVKELIENSLDAGATQINIVIRSGGLQSIQVTDNGHGIAANELMLAVNRHATSKIETVDDLFNLTSMGFRGEALASIASVTRFRLISRTSDAIHASCWQNTTSRIEPAAHPVGTTIYAEELFYNTPVRRRFIKSERTEFKYIEDIVKQMALSNEDVGFTLKHNNRQSLQVPAAQDESDRQQRLIRILGKAYSRRLIKLDFTASNLRLHGWLAEPSVERSQIDLQFFYVNNRMVRDKVILHALKQVMQPLLYPGKQAICVLFLTLPPDQVDVNVHPTKREVRFTSPRLVHDFIVQVLQSSLNGIEPHQFERIADSYQQKVTSFNIAENRSHYPMTAAESAVINSWDDPVFGRYLGLQQKKYALFDNVAGLIVVDIQKAYRNYVRVAIQNFDGAIKYLIVPVSFPLCSDKLSGTEKIITALDKLGLKFSLANDSLRLLAVPVCLENANIQALISDLLTYLTRLELPDDPNLFHDEIISYVSKHVQWNIDSITDARIEKCFSAMSQVLPVPDVKTTHQAAYWRLVTADMLETIFKQDAISLLDE